MSCEKVRAATVRERVDTNLHELSRIIANNRTRSLTVAALIVKRKRGAWQQRLIRISISGVTVQAGTLAKPRIRDAVRSPWRENFRELARRENVFCKLSGMVTEAHWKHWKKEDLAPYLETVLEAFGPERLMFGSDWPVCLLACEYQRWFQVVKDFTSSPSVSEKECILGGTASRVYKL